MAFKQISGKSKVEWWPKKASTELNVGEALIPDGSGAVTTAGATGLRIVGICLKKIASTDSDYADNTKIPVQVPHDEAEFEVDVDNTLTAAMVVELRGLSSNAENVDASNTTNDQVTIKRFITASKAVVTINEAAQYADGA